MVMYQEGYQYYVEKCNDYGMDPLSFRYYVKQLTMEQLEVYNEQARQNREMN